ncbi:MAG: hypothetical protein M0Q48_06645 [Verrucomicrobia bacterium]|nr:hypothetical protein [Verrucomicrobiota bacterium]
MKLKTTLLVCFACVLTGLSIFWQGVIQHKRSMNLRVADMTMLLDAYNLFSQTNSSPPLMSDLCSVLSQQGKVLNNPIAIDTNLPCYHVVPKTNILGETHPDAILIEETDNIADENLRFRGYGDGSIQSFKSH